ncbi:MAG TPA: HD domain-containing protein [Gemmatimonadaceae bacterium]|nr:HD domain-containing protein [Gemmatimonadaceae bacterium]
MSVGYSDVINHALAFAAKHHDRQVRKGTRLPYLTHPANVAIILTRYGRENDTVVSAILHDVIQDCVQDGYSRSMLEQRIGDKFGSNVLDTVLAVTYRKVDDDGVELSGDDRRADYLERLADASTEARWVCAADKIHSAASLISDLRRTVDPDSVWSRFGGKATTSGWYRQVYERLREVGFDAPIMSELDSLSAELVKLAG